MALGHTAIFVAIFGCAIALVCYETQEDGHSMAEHSDDNWAYCVFAVNKLHQKPATVFGVGNGDDMTSLYDKIFGASDADGLLSFSVVSNCMLEKYNLNAPYTFPTYLFRCVCNTNRCNNATDIETFINNLKK